MNLPAADGITDKISSLNLKLEPVGPTANYIKEGYRVMIS